MTFERIKQMILESKLLKVLLGALLILLLSMYFKVFYSIGAHFDDTFLTKKVTSLESHYIGKNKHGNIIITVKQLKNKQNSVDVIYSLPNNTNRLFNVNFKTVNSWETDIENIKDADGNIIFSGGKFKKDVPFLFNEYGYPLVEDHYPVMNYEENAYNSDYKVTLYSVASFATFANDTIRGDFRVLMVAVLIFVLILIDIKAPLFFFMLRNSLDVKDPEPSDYYIKTQRISWIVSPIIALILMIVAIV